MKMKRTKKSRHMIKMLKTLNQSQSENFAIEIKEDKRNHANCHTTHSILITHNKWQWSGMSVSKDELGKVRDAITRYLKENK